MADEAPPNSQQHARANIHVRQVRRTDGRVKTLEQTRRPQLIQTPVVSFLALQHPSTPPRPPSGEWATPCIFTAGVIMAEKKN